MEEQDLKEDLVTPIESLKIENESIFAVRHNDDKKTSLFAHQDLNIGQQNLIQNFTNLDIDNLIETVGSESIYFKLFVFLWCLTSVANGGIIYMQSFILADPDFNCKGIDNKLSICGETEFCSLYFPDAYDVDQIVWKYTNSWTQTHGLICDKAYIRTNFHTIAMVTSAIVGYLTITLSDSFGRVKTLVIVQNFNLAISLVTYFLDNIYFKAFGYALLLASDPICCGLSAIMLAETMPTSSKKRAKAWAIINIFYGVGGILIGLICL